MDQESLEAIGELARLFGESDSGFLHVRTEHFEVTLSRGPMEGGIQEVDRPGSRRPAPYPLPPDAGTPDGEAGEADAGEAATGGDVDGPKARRAPTPSSGTAVEVHAPVVGTFYSAPSPGEAPFVEVGSVVDESTTIGLVEAMKVFTAVSAGVVGTVVSILVDNDAFVEQGQALVVVEPTSA